MRVLAFLMMLLANFFMIGLTIYMFDYNIVYGFGNIIGIIAFYIAYIISVDMILSPRDFWACSNWEIFKVKLRYAFSSYILVMFLASGILGAIFNG